MDEIEACGLPFTEEPKRTDDDICYGCCSSCENEECPLYEG